MVSVLNRERQVLEALLFRLVEARGLLATGEARFLSWAASDLEQAAASVREVEARRAVVLPRHDDGQGLPSLHQLIARTPEPYATMLEEHRVALGRLAVEVGAATEATQALASEGLRRARHHDLALAEVVAGVGRRLPDQPVQHRRPRHQPVDELDLEILAGGYEAVLNASSRLALPSLVRFLG
jgi:hypothetical protein